MREAAFGACNVIAAMPTGERKLSDDSSSPRPVPRINAPAAPGTARPAISRAPCGVVLKTASRAESGNSCVTGLCAALQISEMGSAIARPTSPALGVNPKCSGGPPAVVEIGMDARAFLSASAGSASTGFGNCFCRTPIISSDCISSGNSAVPTPGMVTI